jgi:tetratricopeptide (TPR) repeat protein
MIISVNPYLMEYGGYRLPCLKCGGSSEDEALLCDSCAESCFKESRFLLGPVLIGQSVFSTMRSEGSAAALLGPTASADVVRMTSADFENVLKDLVVGGVKHEELRAIHEICNTLLAHLGIPVNLDQSKILLTEDSAETISVVIQKVDALEQMYPLEAMSDLYIRVGVAYWSASKGILLRTTSRKWQEGKKKLLMSKAKGYFSKVSAKDDLYSIALRDLGMLCLESHEWSDAETHLTNALRHFPNDSRIAESLAKAHLALGNQMDALGRVDDTLAQVETPQLWVLKGRILRDMGRSEDALECFSRALTLDPKFMDAHDMAVLAFRELGRREEAALAERQRALSRTPNLDQKVSDLICELRKSASEVPPVPKTPAPAAHPAKVVPAIQEAVTVNALEQAKISYGEKDFDNAIQHAEHFLKENADSRDAALILIGSLVAKCDMNAASARAHAFYEHNRNDPIAWYWRGVISDKEGKWGAAVQYLSKAVTLDPKLVDAWIAMGETLLSNDKVSGADESFSRALQIDGENPRAWLGKAKAMKGLGRWGAAIQCLDKYNMLVPKDRSAWLMKADLLFEKQKHRRAADSYDKYLELDQDDSYALGRKGIALNALGLTDDAKKCLEESVRLDPNNKEAAKWLKALSSGGGR